MRKLNAILFWCWRSEDYEIKLRERYPSFYEDLYNGRQSFMYGIVEAVYEWSLENLPF